MALGRPLGAKLFLEGIEVPFIGATFTCTVNQASIAYIDLVPHKEINNVKPRTLVQLFVRNYMDPGPNCVFPYVLAWQGEVFGYNFGKTPSSRSFSISCIDYSGHWDCAMAYYFNAQQSLGSGSADRASAAATQTDAQKMKQRILVNTVSEQSFFIQKIRDTLAGNAKLATADKKDFLDGFIAIYDFIGYVNEFFRSANDRLRISDQIVLHSSKNLLELLEENQALNWFMGIPGKSSGYSTLRTVIQDFLSLMFHDFAPIPFPAAVKRKAEFTSQGPDTKRANLRNAKDRTTIGMFAFKPNLYMMPPPACNIFFPDEYSNFQFSRNFFKEPTRLIYMPELPARFGAGAAAVYLPHVYEPPSFEQYMLGTSKTWTSFQGTDSMLIPSGTDPGHWGDTHTKSSEDDFKKLDNNNKREYFFLTNEEYLKGIWMARESMMPATTQFRTALSETEASDAYGKRLNFSKRVARYLFYKKRFQDRSLQITSHLKLSVVPGFPVLILDDGDADQSMVAYCSSVTHRIYATEGGYTNTTLTYARLVTEQDSSSTHGAQFLIPPWFQDSIFGTIQFPATGSKSAPEDVEGLGVQYVGATGKKLTEFFETLLGSKGCEAITDRYKDERTLLGAVKALQSEYRKKREISTSDVQAFIAAVTARDYVRMKDYYSFMDATTQTKDPDTADWIEFTGPGLIRKGKPDEQPIILRRNVVTKYRNILKKQRGFRG